MSLYGVGLGWGWGYTTMHIFIIMLSICFFINILIMAGFFSWVSLKTGIHKQQGIVTEVARQVLCSCSWGQCARQATWGPLLLAARLLVFHFRPLLTRPCSVRAEVQGARPTQAVGHKRVKHGLRKTEPGMKRELEQGGGLSASHRAAGAWCQESQSTPTNTHCVSRKICLRGEGRCYFVGMRKTLKEVQDLPII